MRSFLVLRGCRNMKQGLQVWIRNKYSDIICAGENEETLFSVFVDLFFAKTPFL